MERDLSGVQHDALVEALRLVLAERGPDVCRTEWGKPLGEGLYEFRVRHTAKEIAAMFGGVPPGGKAGERVLLRVFFHAHGKRVVLLLGGYNKGKDPSTTPAAGDRRRAQTAGRFESPAGGRASRSAEALRLQLDGSMGNSP